MSSAIGKIFLLSTSASCIGGRRNSSVQYRGAGIFHDGPGI